MAAAQSIGPVIVVETSRGTFSFETFPNDAPLTVAHVVALVKSGFYDGQRVHRAVPGFRRPVWRSADPRHLDPRALGPRRGRRAAASRLALPKSPDAGSTSRALSRMAHLGDPAKADSQLYVTLANRPDLDGQYAVFGQVTDGEEVVESLQVGDVIARVSVKP